MIFKWLNCTLFKKIIFSMLRKFGKTVVYICLILTTVGGGALKFKIIQCKRFFTLSNCQPTCEELEYVNRLKWISFVSLNIL